jgi:hypothetical protein
MESVPTDLKLWLTDRDPKSLEEMAKLADQFVTLRKAISPAEHYQEIQDNMLVSARPFVKSTRPWVKPNVPVVVDKVVESPVEKRDKLYSRSDLSQVRCFYCEKTGHKIAQCRAKQQKEEKEVKKDVFPKDSSASQSFLVCDCRPLHSNGEVAFQLPIHPLFKPFCATAHIVNLNGLQAPINVLRDTGTLQSVIKQATLTNIDYVKTEQVRLLKGITSKIIEVPLIEIQLKTDQFDAIVLCGVIDELPEGIDFLLGNDIACLTDNVQAPVMQSVITRAQAIAAQPPIVDIHAGSINTPAVVVDSDVIGLHDESEHLLQAGRYVKNLDCEAVQDREHLIKLQQQDAYVIHVFEQFEQVDVDFPVGQAYIEREVDSVILETVRFVGEIETELTEISVTPDHCNLDNMPLKEREELEWLLTSFVDIFSDVPGKTASVKHSIVLKPNSRSVQMHPYRGNPVKAVLRTELDSILKLGVIEDCNSEFASPVVMIPKLEESIRFCCENERLNDITQPDVCLLPRIDELIDKIGEAKYMTKIELNRDYWQVPIVEVSIPLSGFVKRFGHFHWKYKPILRPPELSCHFRWPLIARTEPFCFEYDIP